MTLLPCMTWPLPLFPIHSVFFFFFFFFRVYFFRVIRYSNSSTLSVCTPGRWSEGNGHMCCIGNRPIINPVQLNLLNISCVWYPLRGTREVHIFTVIDKVAWGPSTCMKAWGINSSMSFYPANHHLSRSFVQLHSLNVIGAFLLLVLMHILMALSSRKARVLSRICHANRVWYAFACTATIPPPRVWLEISLKICFTHSFRSDRNCNSAEEEERVFKLFSTLGFCWGLQGC